MPFLEVFRGTQSSIIELTKKSFTIGRHEDCDLVLMAETISREHARVEKKRNSYFIEDCRSRHGTALNGEKVSGATKLSENDLIDFSRISGVFGLLGRIFYNLLGTIHNCLTHISGVWNVFVQTILFIDPDHYDAHLLLANVLEKRGDLEDATWHLWTARRLEDIKKPRGPSTEYKRRLLRLYQQLLDEGKKS